MAWGTSEASPELSGDGDGVSRHRVYKWMEIAMGQEEDDVLPREVAVEHGVPQKVFLSHVESEIQQEESFKTLPFAALLVVIFAVVFVNHDRAAVVLDLQESMINHVQENANFGINSVGSMGHKTIFDVHSRTDFFSWLRMGLVPLVLDHAASLPEGRALPLAEDHEEARQHLLNYNRLLGGMQLRQARGAVDHQAHSGAFVFRKPKIPFGDATVLQQHFKPEEAEVSLGRSDFDEDRTRWLGLNMTGEELEAVLLDMEDSIWFDDATSEVEVSFVLYNMNFDALTCVRIVVVQSRSGRLRRLVTAQSHLLHIYVDDSALPRVLDAVFLVQLVVLLVWEIWDLIRTCKQHRGKGLVGAIGRYCNVWNLVDWATVIAGAVLVLQYLGLQGRTSQVEDQLYGMDMTGQAQVKSYAELHDFMEALRDVESEYRWLRSWAGCFPLLLMTRLLEAFSAQPRLAVLTKTLRLAATDLIHFGIVFLSAFWTYAVMGHVLFGRALPEFATLSRALQTCFAILFGDFSFDDMLQSGRMVACLWLATYLCLVLLIILNMLLAIIMDTYTNVKGQVADTDETLWQQAKELGIRWERTVRGQRVPLSKIWGAFDARLGGVHEALYDREDSQRHRRLILRVADLVDIVPGMQPAQALRLLTHATESYRGQFEAARGLSIADAMNVINAIHLKLAHFIKETRRLRGVASKSQLSGVEGWDEQCSEMSTMQEAGAVMHDAGAAMSEFVAAMGKDNAPMKAAGAVMHGFVSDLVEEGRGAGAAVQGYVQGFAQHKFMGTGKLASAGGKPKCPGSAEQDPGVPQPAGGSPEAPELQGKQGQDLGTPGIPQAHGARPAVPWTSQRQPAAQEPPEAAPRAAEIRLAGQYDLVTLIQASLDAAGADSTAALTMTLQAALAQAQSELLARSGCSVDTVVLPPKVVPAGMTLERGTASF
mmetsp:Transcript_75494/g.201827  ORF Transcript_75494/g.201827 Transcript_75494/m.201827 type:complete len:937 (+) Transcript_75494:3-2813(+)